MFILVLTIIILVMAMKIYDNTDSKAMMASTWSPWEPFLPGMMPGISKPRLIIAQDINYPPYAYLAVPPEGDYSVGGFNPTVGAGVAKACGMEYTPVQTKWKQCWDAGAIGEGLVTGQYHGCSSYTHTQGERTRFMEFSYGILKMNKPGGILVRLKADGTPEVSPTHDLTGLTVHYCFVIWDRPKLAL